MYARGLDPEAALVRRDAGTILEEVGGSSLPDLQVSTTLISS